jgi:hypothetical protein
VGNYARQINGNQSIEFLKEKIAARAKRLCLSVSLGKYGCIIKYVVASLPHPHECYSGNGSDSRHLPSLF